MSYTNQHILLYKKVEILTRLNSFKMSLSALRKAWKQGPQTERLGKSLRDAWIHGFMSDSLTDEEREWGIKNPSLGLSPKEQKIVDHTSDLCVAMHQKEQLQLEAKTREDETRVAISHLDQKIESLKSVVAELKKSEDLPEQTQKDLAAIVRLMSTNPKMRWYTFVDYPSQCALCEFNAKTMPLFSDPEKNIRLTLDDETKFVRLPGEHETWAVLANTKQGKMVGLHNGRMEW